MNMYFAALVLPSHLDAEIRKYKEWARDRWNCTVGLRSPAHITLVPPFWMHPDKESEWQVLMNHVAVPFAPFVIRLQSFSAFPPRTIFIDVALNLPLDAVKKAADHFLTTHPQFSLQPEKRAFHPHVTIATRDLRKKDFAEAWDFFKTKEYEREWVTPGISMLRHDQKKWDVIHTSHFNQI